MSAILAALINGGIAGAAVAMAVWLALSIAPRRALNAATRPPGSTVPASSRRLWLVDDKRQMAIDGNGAVPDAVTNFVKYQAGSEVTLDGNSVDLDQEKTAAAANAVQYEAAATFTTQTIRMLMTAINGSGSQPSSGS